MLGNSGNTNIFNNKIHGLLFNSTNSTSSSARGIMCSPTAGNVMNIYNNELYFDETVTHNANSYKAINIYNSGTANISYNSIYIGGEDIITSYGSYGIYSYGSVAPTIKNNADLHCPIQQFRYRKTLRHLYNRYSYF